jgi:hypothetical protein
MRFLKRPCPKCQRMLTFEQHGRRIYIPRHYNRVDDMMHRCDVGGTWFMEKPNGKANRSA